MATQANNSANILRQAVPLERLFDRLDDTVFFIKDASGRYDTVNDTLVKRAGRLNKKELIGKTPAQILGPALGEGYEAQDRKVLEVGSVITDQLELHVYPNRSIGWCVTNKNPLRNTTGDIIGIAGISKDLRTPDVSQREYQRLSDVIAYIAENLSDPPSIEDISAHSGMTPYQLDRRIVRIFGLTTGRWVLKQRVDYARRRLHESDDPIADIALNAGYKDQSAFTRQFRKITGLTPSQFRALNSK